jgi:hypothetical protein
MNIIIPSVIKHLEESLSVYGTGKVTLDSKYCYEESILIYNYYQTEVEADLVIFFNYDNSDEGYVAAATSCMNTDSNWRPTAGAVWINIFGIYDFTP